MAAIDLKYEVEGTVNVHNSVTDYRDTSSNGNVTNMFRFPLLAKIFGYPGGVPPGAMQMAKPPRWRIAGNTRDRVLVADLPNKRFKKKGVLTVRKSFSKRLTSILLASIMTAQLASSTVVFADDSTSGNVTVIDGNQSVGDVVTEGNPVLLDVDGTSVATNESAASDGGEDASSPTSDPSDGGTSDSISESDNTTDNGSDDTVDEGEQQNVDPDAAYTVIIDPAGGSLPIEWIETANSDHFGLNNGTVSVTDSGGVLTVSVVGRSDLYLMAPTPASDDAYFVGWSGSGADYCDEEYSVLTFDSSIDSYTLTAVYSSIEEESEMVQNAREFVEFQNDEQESTDSGVSLFALKPTDSFTPIQLAMEGMEFVYEDGQIQTFTAPYDGEYIITAYGANGGTGYGKYDGYGVPGRGGMTEATVNLKEGQTIYLYLGEAGGDWSTERTFGGGGGSTDLAHAWYGSDDGSAHIFGRGGGATYVSIDEFDMANAGQAQWDFTDEQKAQNDVASEEAKKHIIMLAAGGGGAGEMGSPYSHYGLNGGGYEGGVLRHHNQYYLPMEQVGQVSYDATVGGRTLTREERLEAWIWPATQTRAGYGLHYSILGNLYDPNPANKDPIELLYPEREARNWGSFFFGSNAMACTGAGGGGWFGGGTDYSFDGGGGSSYIGTSLTNEDGSIMTISDSETVAGANVKYDNTKSSPFYVNGRVIIRLKDGQAQMYSELQEAANEEISSEHLDTITNDKFGQGVRFPQGVTESDETVGYTTVIYYTPGPDVLTVTPEWYYSSYTSPTFKPWNDEQAKKINSNLEVNITSEELGVLQPGDKYYKEEYADRNVMVTRMTISNVYLGIFDPANIVGYRFKGGATATFALSSGIGSIDTQTEDDGGLVTETVSVEEPDYSIDMHHMGVNTYNNVNNINVPADTNPANTNSLAEIVKNTAEHDSSTWAYPDLIVETPKVLRTFNVLFTSPSRNGNDTINYDKNMAQQLGIVVSGTDENLIFLQVDGLDENQWTNFLRTVTFTTYDAMVVEEDGIKGGVNIEWAGFEEAIGTGNRNDDYPKLSDYSDVINHDISKGNLTINKSNTVYHVTGQTSKYIINVASGVTTTVFLDNVTMSTSTSSSDSNTRGYGCIISSGANLTLVLMGTSKLTSNGGGSNAITKNGTGGELIIDGDGTLYASGNESVFHAGAIGATAHFELHNLTIRGGTIIAQAGQHCPGIGSGCQKLCENVKIEGGTVYAYGNDSCAGIGSGLGGPVNGIYISNGAKVEAHGGKYSPGIGSGGANSTYTLNTNYHYHTSNIIISGGDTVVTAFGDKATNMPGIGVGKHWDGRVIGRLTNVIARTDDKFQGYVRYGSSEENASYSTENPVSPFTGIGYIGTYLNDQFNAGTPVFYTQVFFSADTSKKSLGDADIIGTQVEHTAPYESDVTYPSVSGVVWAENDYDGTYEQGDDPVIPNVEVSLVRNDGSVTATTMTNSVGQYTFVQVPNGEYHIEFIIPEDTIPDTHEPTKIVQPSRDTVVNDTKPDYSTDNFTIVTGTTPAPVNCGIYIPSSISGFVWDDHETRDGIFENEETTIEGLNVSLQQNGEIAKDAYGNDLATVTDSDGNYVFENVPASGTTYDVVITSGDDISIESATVSPIPDSSTPAEVANTASPVSFGDISASQKLEQAVIANLYITNVGSDLAAVNLEYKNCALSVRNTVWGYVWAETDNDGIMTGTDITATTENPLPEVKVTLLNTEDEQVSLTYTSETGYYEFGDLEPGEYKLLFEAAEGFDANGKLPDGASDFSDFQAATIPADQSDTSNYYNNAKANSVEIGYPGLTVLHNLITDDFSIESATLENPEDSAKNLNAALFAPSTISGHVWEDYDQDGIREENEVLLDGVSVTLLEYVSGDPEDVSSYTPYLLPNGKPATIQTNEYMNVLGNSANSWSPYDGYEGYYAFYNLPSGRYGLKFESGDFDIRYYIASPKNVGNDTTIDSDVVGTYTEDGEQFAYGFVSDLVVPAQSEMDEYDFSLDFMDFGAYQKLRDVTVTKQIRASEIEWDHGTPTFMITVYGTDQKGVFHEYNHAYEFTQKYVEDNTDENGIVSMTYTFEGIPYARIYNVEEQNTSRFCLEAISGSDNATFEGEVAALDMKYNVSGEVTFLNKVSHYRNTSANSLVTNSLLAG